MYIKERHYSVSDQPWDQEKVRKTIQMIVDDAQRDLYSDYLWPTHPLDDDYCTHHFYSGTGGVTWALDYLQRQGMVLLF